MLFNSYPFIFGFLPTTFVVFFLLGRVNRLLAACWLACASLFFYAWWDVRYLGLLLASVAFNYAIGFAITRANAAGESRKSRLLMATGIVGNLTALAYFKYALFTVTTLSALVGKHIAIEPIILPLGISFFTFTQIAFLVDASRGEAQEYNPVHYLLFVTYFPHLIAGPILHHREMMPQFVLDRTYRIDPEKVALGLSAFSFGLFKKVILADNLARFASPVFDVAAVKSVLFYEAWIGALAYALQLYFDFSGYCDMAIGLSLMFGIRLPLNFNSPYKAANIADFWRRWHMTLSRFLRDYVYFPLGGNRRGTMRRYLNLLTTMLLGGLWHGAAWTFVAWGGLHGMYLAINHVWQGLSIAARLRTSVTWCFFGRAITFLAVVIGWVFFRAESFATAARVLRGMSDVRQIFVLPEQLLPYLGTAANVLRAMGVTFKFGSVPLILQGPLWIVPLLVVVLTFPNVQEILGQQRLALSNIDSSLSVTSGWTWRPTARWAMTLAALIVLGLASINEAGEFLYYQF